MRQTDQRDYEQLLDLAVHVLETRRPELIWPRIAEELGRALGGAAVVMKDGDWTESAGHVRVWQPGASSEYTATPDTARCIRLGYPLGQHYAATADRTPMTAEQFVGSRQWFHSETASVMREAFGTRHLLGLPLRGVGSVHGFVIHRAGQGYTSRDSEYALRAQPLLTAAAAHHAALERHLSPRHGTDRDAPANVAEGLGLTPREVTVLELLADGLSARAMAHRLTISVRTIHKHLQQLYRKLETNDRLTAVLRAQQLGLLPRDDE
ncbi:LuxR C-terminal-related transcriptional regulator [Streptomyces sp. NPDC012510]|uniref:helix-turn-helix transcriptional regulator n=1 Tax=Streptomyces sp. NPDC012510 TaxID=3364838 RepID=UPI0036ECB104